MSLKRRASFVHVCLLALRFKTMMSVSLIVHIWKCGETYVFFDPLGSSVSVLSPNTQLLALYNGCQEVVSKGVLDRFVRLSQPSITLTFNTLEANNKNQQLSRGSKLVNAHQYVTGKTLMKSQTSARRIKNSIPTLFRGAECFRLVRSFRTGRGHPKSQTFLSENRESASGLV